jgi:hypothetical protein
MTRGTNLFVHWDISKMILLLLAAFATGAMGFFLFTVATQPLSGPKTVDIIVSDEQVMEHKQTILNNLAQNSVPVTVQSSGTSTSSSTLPHLLPANAVGTSSPVSPQQADTNDAYAVRKLDILKSLNAKK